MFRFLAFLGALGAVLIIPSAAVFILAPVPRAEFEVKATPVHLNETDPKMMQLGSLRFLGGWALTSDQRQFGSLSGLIIDKGRFLSVSDYGALIRFNLTKGEIEPLPRGCGQRAYKWAQDAESLAKDAKGTLWVGLEGLQAICSIRKGAKTAFMNRPPAMEKWWANGGPEAMTILPDGSLLVFEENRFSGKKPRELLRFNPGLTKLGYLGPEGFSPTDVAALPDGRLLVLNRKFKMPFEFTASLVLIDKPNYSPGQIVSGREIARFENPVIADNFESITTQETPEGTEIWILSDDNFMPMQRTLLLRFLLKD